MNNEINAQWLRIRGIFSSAGYTQQRIADGSKVSQSAVSRVLRAPPNRNGPAFRRLCVYANRINEKQLSAKPQTIENEDLVSAIREVWVGTPEHAKALAAMIRAVGDASRAAIS